jgi:hypothetical protein
MLMSICPTIDWRPDTVCQQDLRRPEAATPLWLAVEGRQCNRDYDLRLEEDDGLDQYRHITKAFGVIPTEDRSNVFCRLDKGVGRP